MHTLVEDDGVAGETAFEERMIMKADGGKAQPTNRPTKKNQIQTKRPVRPDRQTAMRMQQCAWRGEGGTLSHWRRRT
jgi:hypothetical protein